MKTILNLTQHVASAEQLKVGVFEPVNKEFVKAMLTFDTLPSKGEIEERAKKLAMYALDECFETDVDSNVINVMIGGAPFFMGPLEKELKNAGLKPLYAFSQRVVEEDPNTGEKKSMFKHMGFI